VVDDLIVSRYFKRLTMIDLSLGDVDFHLARFSEVLLGSLEGAGLRNAVHAAAENTSTLATITGDALMSTP